VFSAPSVPMVAQARTEYVMPPPSNNCIATEERYFLRGPCRDVINIRGLNLAVVKSTTVQVTKMPLQLKIRKIGMICSVKPILTEDLCVVKQEEFSITCYMCDTYT
jgi:hypothetical protein